MYTPQILSLTPVQSGVTVVNGGYSRIGNLVIIGVTIKASSATSTGMVLDGLPQESTSMNHDLSAADMNYNFVASRVYGRIVFCKALSADTMVAISGVYILS